MPTGAQAVPSTLVLYEGGTGRLVSDPVLPAELCNSFKVDPSYLVGNDATLPERIDSQLEFVKSLRAARVKSFAARTLGDVSPETLRAISECLTRTSGAIQEGKKRPLVLQKILKVSRKKLLEPCGVG